MRRATKSHQCTHLSSRKVVVVLGLLFMMLLPAMTSVVDGRQIQAQPTAEATSTPTKEVDVPPQDDEID